MFKKTTVLPNYVCFKEEPFYIFLNFSSKKKKIYAILLRSVNVPDGPVFAISSVSTVNRIHKKIY